MKVQVVFFGTLAVVFSSWAPEPPKYHGPQHFPIIHNGVPVETPEVQHAKAAHFAALAEAYAHADTHEDHEEDVQDLGYQGDYGYSVHHQYHDIPEVHHAQQAYETSHVIPEIGHDGKPLDTPEVEAAKAKHFAAYHEALARTAPHGASYHYRKRRSADYYPYESFVQLPQAPEDTFEVQQARAEHLAAHAQAHSGSYGFTYHQIHAPIYENHYSHEVPEIGHDGKPVDTAEVEEAKAAHFAAHQEALLRNSGHNVGYGGPQQVEDTPEVQHAKYVHFAAHAAAREQQYHY